ncbi:hypothetical protein [Chryseobacterium chendengshani]|uniref:hypothetical protein n=1 Tax=Chryseobacterium sp. LJ756 TaxID=2864113 RepID=UPI001C63DEFE|nr:hypothetical protein [Chryseobacterium sp. LJ756]MBW7674254.1 hypothetical protein [Chryseobacterium sp. LJ756]
MKKIRDIIERHILKADQKWKALPAKRQRLMTTLFFGCYAVLTIVVLVSIVFSTGNKNSIMSITHITSISDHAAVDKTADYGRTNTQHKK